MLCAKCHNENLADAVFCAECGVSLDLVCLSCGVANAPGSKFCRKCGTHLIGDSAGNPAAGGVEFLLPKKSLKLTGAAEPDSIPIGERKTVTALFADIKGSMDLMEDIDPEQARAIVDPALKLMIDAVHRYDGYIVQSTGDGIFAIFGAPVAHEARGSSATSPARCPQDAGGPQAICR
jgi:ribosomal protein L40E